MRKMIAVPAILGALSPAGCAESGNWEDFCATLDRTNHRWHGDGYVDDPDPSDAVARALEDMMPPEEMAEDWQVLVDTTRKEAEGGDTSDDPHSEAAFDRVDAQVETRCGHKMAR